jgi:hypothetical protein
MYIILLKIAVNGMKTSAFDLPDYIYLYIYVCVRLFWNIILRNHA